MSKYPLAELVNEGYGHLVWPHIWPQETRDPYDLFNEWCYANGFSELMDSPPGETDLQELDEALWQYGQDYEGAKLTLSLDL